MASISLIRRGGTRLPRAPLRAVRGNYEAVIELEGAAKLADPVTKIVFEKIGSDTGDELTAVLDRLA